MQLDAGSALSALRSRVPQLQQAVGYGAPRLRPFTSLPLAPRTGASILQPRGISFTRPLLMQRTMTMPQTIPALRLFGSAGWQTTGGAAGPSAARAAAFLLATGLTARVLQVQAEEERAETERRTLYTTYAGKYGSVNGYLHQMPEVMKDLQKGKAVDLARLIAMYKKEQAAAIFADAKAVAAIKQITQNDNQAAMIITKQLAKLIDDTEVLRVNKKWCCSSELTGLLNQLIENDSNGEQARMLVQALNKSQFTTVFDALLDNDLNIAKETITQGGFWGWFGQTLVTGEDQQAAQASTLRRLVDKDPQAAIMITNKIIYNSSRYKNYQVPFYTIKYLVDHSPDAAQKFADKMSDEYVAQMAKQQNISESSAQELQHKLHAARADRLQE
jgi:acetolactate synthase small subunit